MNAVEHYREAERCIEMAQSVDFDHAAFLHREAQVHATLAQVAVTVETADNAAALLHSWTGAGWFDAPRAVKHGGPWGKVLYPQGGAES